MVPEIMLNSCKECHGGSPPCHLTSSLPVPSFLTSEVKGEVDERDEGPTEGRTHTKKVPNLSDVYPLTPELISSCEKKCFMFLLSHRC